MCLSTLCYSSLAAAPGFHINLLGGHAPKSRRLGAEAGASPRGCRTSRGCLGELDPPCAAQGHRVRHPDRHHRPVLPVAFRGGGSSPSLSQALHPLCESKAIRGAGSETPGKCHFPPIFVLCGYERRMLSTSVNLKK